MVLTAIHPMLQPVLVLLNKQCSSGWIAITCYKEGTVYFSLKVYRREALLIATAYLQHFLGFGVIFGVGRDKDSSLPSQWPSECVNK